MSDRRTRDLERAARNGDHEAAEALYYDRLRTSTGSQILDRLIEEVITLRTQRAPSVWDKLNWINNQAAQSLSPQQLLELRIQHRVVDSAQDLHRIPRIIREDGFTVYCRSDRQVFRLNSGMWDKLATLSSPPPGWPFAVYRTVRERDQQNPNPEVGSSCLVLENGGVYRAESSRSTFSPHRNMWNSIRFEKVSR